MAFPTTFGDTQTAVKHRLRLTTSADTSRVKDWINQAYHYVCTECEVTQHRATMPLTANSATYSLPTEIIKLKELAIKGAGQSDYGAPLEELSVEDLLNYRKSAGGVSAQAATPTHFAMSGLYTFELWPTPAAADTLLVYYVYAPTALVADGDIAILQEPWNTKLLEYGALVEASDDLDTPKADIYRQWFDEWLMRFKRHLNRRTGPLQRQMQVMYPRPYVPHDPSTDLGY